MSKLNIKELDFEPIEINMPGGKKYTLKEFSVKQWLKLEELEYKMIRTGKLSDRIEYLSKVTEIPKTELEELSMSVIIEMGRFLTDSIVAAKKKEKKSA